MVIMSFPLSFDQAMRSDGYDTEIEQDRNKISSFYKLFQVQIKIYVVVKGKSCVRKKMQVNKNI